MMERRGMSLLCNQRVCLWILFDWACALGGVPSMSIVEFFDSLYLWVVFFHFFEKGLCTFCVILFSLLIYIYFYLLVKRDCKKHWLCIWVSWILPKKVSDLLMGWRNWLGKHASDIWNLVPLCVMWIIWR